MSFLGLVASIVVLHVFSVLLGIPFWLQVALVITLGLFWGKFWAWYWYA